MDYVPNLTETKLSQCESICHIRFEIMKDLYLVCAKANRKWASEVIRKTELLDHVYWFGVI